MKKLLLTGGALAMLLTGQKAGAQALSQNFDSGIPATWTMINDGLTPNSNLTQVDPNLVTNLTASAWTTLAFSATNQAAVTTSWFASAATADRWLISPAFTVTATDNALQFDVASYDPFYNQYFDSVQVLVSTTAGTTAASFTTTLYNGTGGANAWATHAVDLTPYIGQTITIAFRDHSHDEDMLLLDNVKTVSMAENDIAMTALTNSIYGHASASVPVTGVVTNNGSANITSFNINYMLGNGSVVTSPITGVTIPALSTYNFTATSAVLPATAGNNILKVWATLTGDANHSNDSISGSISVPDSFASKMVMMEEFNQASCDPCAEATPNVDSVIYNNLYRLNAVRYHVNFPGRDCMDSVTLGEFVQDQLSFYQVSGVPDARLDGVDTYPGAGYFMSSAVASAQQTGAPMKIAINSTNYDAASNTYTASVTITSLMDAPAGLKLKAALTVDTIRYHANQSTESIAQTQFPQVAEHMFPDANGTTLGAFTSGQSQTINLSWVKNHPWGSDFSVWPYDSTATGHITAWIQYDPTAQVLQSATASVATGGTGMTTAIATVDAIVNNVTVFPNPTSANATLHISLKDATDLNISVTDMTGREVYNNTVGHTAAGDVNLTIPTAALANGMYNVLVKTTGGTVTKRLSVVK